MQCCEDKEERVDDRGEGPVEADAEVLQGILVVILHAALLVAVKKRSVAEIGM